MSKRKYIIIALLGFVLAFFFSELVFDALRRVVLPDHVSITVLRPTGGIFNFFRFALALGVACVAILTAFLIIRNNWLAAMVVILSLAAAGIALFVIRSRLHAGIATLANVGVDPVVTAGGLHLEIVPWVSFGATVLGTIALKMKRNQIVLAIIGLLIVCLGAQTVQQIHSLRWEWEVQTRFEKAFDIQTRIEQLKAGGAAPDEIATHSEALRATMTDAGELFNPYFVPRWLQICANFGAFLSVVALVVLWKMKPKQRDAGADPVPAASSSQTADGPAGDVPE